MRRRTRSASRSPSSRARHTLPQEAINALIVAHVRAGSIVVRLKGGDPFVFGRGGEEVEAVRAAGLPVEVIPGVSAALGCAAEAMLPLTHRDWSSAVSFVAGQCKGLTEQDWSGLAGKGRTLVIYMGVANAAAIADKLMADGVAPDLPVAVLEKRHAAGAPRDPHAARRSRRHGGAREGGEPGDHRRRRGRAAVATPRTGSRRWRDRRRRWHEDR